MKKTEQMHINEIVENHAKLMNEELQTLHSPWKKFRSCNAETCMTRSYYVLRSYNIVVACIHRKSDMCCDFLRKVYGYTATSAQHIAKFRKDYGGATYDCMFNCVWKEV